MALQVFFRNYYFNSFSQWLWVFFNSLVGTLVKYRVKTESLGNNEEGNNEESGPSRSCKKYSLRSSFSRACNSKLFAYPHKDKQHT